MEKPVLVKADAPTPDETIPLTDAQIQILQGLERQVVSAMRDREVALRMALAAAGKPQAQITGYDFEAKVLRVKPPAAQTQ